MNTKYYTIEFKGNWDNNTDWQRSIDVPENRYQSYDEALHRVYVLQSQFGLEYRIIENVMLSTEVRIFPKILQKTQ